MLPSSTSNSISDQQGLASFAAFVIYNIFFHPLARFPGPLLYRATRFPYSSKLLRGKLPFAMLDLHRKYGPIVRIAPNELSISDPQAWKDICGHRVGAAAGQEENAKWLPFYRPTAMPPSIITEDKEGHAMLRRQLAHGFSESAMRAQEPIIGGYLDLLVRRLREHAVDGDRKDAVTGLPTKRVLDMTAWYNWTTFDIIGDLAFGEAFGSLERAKYDPWVKAINTNFRVQTLVFASKFLGLSDLVLVVARAIGTLIGRKDDHVKRTGDMLRRRMALDVERPDLIEGLLKKKDEWSIDFGRLHMNAAVLIVAGSETTATLLSGVTYMLLKHPEALKRVTEEVRSSFQSDDEITLTSVGNLSYMLACLNEGLRIYPPVAGGLPRITPRGGATILGEFIPGNTVMTIFQWALYHNEKYWTDPFGFHPERFLNDPKFAHDRFDALQPFSFGPRNCIGRNLAYAEMRLILARILFNFDMHLVDGGKDWLDQPAYVLWDKHPLDVYLTPVER
ncbi:cytochrome P450 [Podospora didyma]|uniref:Cytochrome P450 n=1 Tax=Podospora didyma TaxID=330526 RepID=A0AAE0NQ05_9PEZI|nr:cytochrome P450 [Podospora didyma]